MLTSVIRQKSAETPFARTGIRHMSDFVMRHKRFAGIALVALVVSSSAIVSQALSGSVERTVDQQANQESSISNPSPDSSGKQTVTQEDQMQSNINIESNHSTNGSGSSGVDVTVNGQDIPVPENGSVHKQMTDNNGQSTVDIKVDNGSSHNGSSSSSTVIIEQHSYSSGNETEKGGTSRHPGRR